MATGAIDPLDPRRPHSEDAGSAAGQRWRSSAKERSAMQIPKNMLVERIRARGDADAAERAERELPEQVDPERDGELLRGFDIDPEALLDEYGGQSPSVG
jgi:hypothetical protein